MADGGKVIIKIDGDTKPFENSMSTAKDGISSLNKSFIAVGAAGVAGFAVATKAGMTFESQISSVQAISGATSAEMEQLTAKAKQMGIESAFSATESGKALEYMAMAGWKTEEMVSGLEGVMNLAAASGEDLGMVSDIVTDSMTAFGLAADQSGRFADVLAAASSNANTNVSMMGETFKYVAPVAGSLGYSVEDTAVAIGLMANAGIKGSQAGTALRGLLTNLVKPTKQSGQAMDDLGISITDSQGNIKPFNTLLQELREKFSVLTDAQKAEYGALLAGQEGMSGMLAIVNASDDDFNKLTESINNSSGAAQKMADTKLDNLKGQLTLLGSSFEGLGIAIYEKFGSNFQSIIESMIEKINTFIDKLSSGELDGILSGIATGITGIGTALLLLNVAYIIQDVMNAFKGLEAQTKLVAAAQKILNIVMGMSPFMLVVTLITAVVAALVVLWNTNEDFRNAVIKAWGAIKETAINVWNKVAKLFMEDIPNAFNACLDFVKTNWKQIILFITNPIAGAIALLYKLNPKFKAWVDQILDFFKTLPKNLLDIGRNMVTGIWNGFKEKFSGMINKIKGLIDLIPESIKKVLGIHSPSRVMRDEVGKMIAEGIAVGIEENSDSVVDAFQKMLDKLEYQRKFDIISEDEYYTELEKLRDKYFKVGSKEWLSYTEKIYSYQKQQLEDEKKLYKETYKDIESYASERLDGVIKKQEEYSKKLKSYGSLFTKNTIEFDDTKMEFYTLSDLKKDTEAIKQYNSLLSSVRDDILNSGISQSTAESFFEELNNLSVDEATKILQVVKNTDKDEFAEYLKAYEEKLTYSESASAAMYKKDFDNAMDDVTQNMKDKLSEAGFEIPETFFDAGKDSALKFGEAFSKEISGVFDEIKVKIESFMSKLQVSFAAGTVNSGGGTVIKHNETYSSHYYVQPADGESTQKQLWSIKNAEFLKKQRGY